jgi:vacuolar protein sorting-associated protein 51
MRSNMDPLSPSTSTLAPAISHIAETAASLSKELKIENVSSQSTEQLKRESDKALVAWILQSPNRLKSLIETGQKREALHQWSIIQRILDRWKDVKGIDDVRSTCQRVLQEISTGE